MSHRSTVYGGNAWAWIRTQMQFGHEDHAGNNWAKLLMFTDAKGNKLKPNTGVKVRPSGKADAAFLKTQERCCLCQRPKTREMLRSIVEVTDAPEKTKHAAGRTCSQRLESLLSFTKELIAVRAWYRRRAGQVTRADLTDQVKRLDRIKLRQAVVDGNE